MLEAPLRDLISNQLDVLESGLTLLNTEQYIPSTMGTRSFIDILARDERGRWVLIEVKRSNASAREAIHEIYKYVEAVKKHLGARDDEIRTIVASTEWHELLSPFSRFVHDTSISATGKAITIDEETNEVSARNLEPLPIRSGRVLSPWHEISLYENPERLDTGLASYDASCQAKGITDYVMVVLKAPDDFYQESVRATARALQEIHGGTDEPSEQEIADTAKQMEQMDHMIYFVPQLLSTEEYFRIIQSDSSVYEEVKEFSEEMEGEELLASLQEYALYANPKVDRDYFEIGYPAKFQSKLLDSEGWNIEAIHRRGAFSRNKNLTDETILSEIAGEAGTSGQRLKRSILLSSKAEFAQLLKDLTECLPNNPVWRSMIRDQLEEARAEFPRDTIDVSVFAPSAGMLTLFFAVTEENGILYVPTYSLTVKVDGEIRRMYAGELKATDNTPVDPDAFKQVLNEFYDGEIGALTMTMTWGGYEARDSEVLEELGLTYDSFRCDADGDDRQFYRMKNGRWRDDSQVVPLGEFKSYLEQNERLLKIIVRKLSPRIGPGICDGSSADRQLEDYVEAETASRSIYYANPPDQCDICTISLSEEKFMSDCKIRGHGARANMCADCTIYYGAGIGWGIGQLYRHEKDDRWLLVGGSDNPANKDAV